MRPNHTPAPWTAVDRRVFADRGGLDYLLAIFASVAQDGFTNYEEDEANARIAAAAPELLVALQELGKCRICWGETHYWISSPDSAPVKKECGACDGTGYARTALAALRKAGVLPMAAHIEPTGES